MKHLIALALLCVSGFAVANAQQETRLQLQATANSDCVNVLSNIPSGSSYGFTVHDSYLFNSPTSTSIAQVIDTVCPDQESNNAIFIVYDGCDCRAAVNAPDAMTVIGGYASVTVGSGNPTLGVLSGGEMDVANNGDVPVTVNGPNGVVTIPPGGSANIS